MAAVRLEDAVWKDWRFKALARRCGLPHRWAIGFMAEVFSWCTERNSDTLPIQALDVMGADDGVATIAAMLLECELAELVDGGLRIKGCMDEHGRSRIGWLAERRAAAKRGGEASATKRQANLNQTPSKPQPNANPPAPDLTPAPALASSKPRPESTSAEILAIPELALVGPHARPRFDFERLFREYPRKEKKRRGLEIAKRDIRTEEGYGDLLQSIRNYSSSVEGKDPKYTMQFSTFMTNWRDYLDPSTARPARFIDRHNLKSADLLAGADSMAAAREMPHDRRAVSSQPGLYLGSVSDDDSDGERRGRVPPEADRVRAQGPGGGPVADHGEGQVLSEHRRDPGRARGSP